MEQNFQNKIQELSQAFQDVQFKMEKKLAKMHNRNEKVKNDSKNEEKKQNYSSKEKLLTLNRFKIKWKEKTFYSWKNMKKC